MLQPTAIRSLLRNRRLGVRIDCLDETDSTNTDLLAAGRAGASEGSVIIAEAQRRGRGRLGRSWVSPAGLNLYCSVLLRPSLPPEEVPLLTLVAGVAVADAVAEVAGAGVAIKWPNDVLLGGRKVAGILTEMEVAAARDIFVVVGMGVNLNAGAEHFPPELRDTATSIARSTGRKVEREVFAAHLLDALDARYESLLREGFSALLPAWSARDALRGQRIQVRAGDEIVDGVACGLSANGRLLLESDGRRREIVAGEVSVIDGYRRGATAG